MNHRSGLDRCQTLLFPERLEDYISPENLVCFLNAFVTSLDLPSLGFAKGTARLDRSSALRSSHSFEVVSLRVPARVVCSVAQAVVDHKNKLLVADDITNDGTDWQQLSGLAKDAKANLKADKLEVVADTGYCTTAQVVQCREHRIIPYGPKADTSANSAQGLFGKSAFTYDPQKDVYLCLAGSTLTYRFNTDEKGRQLRYYRASNCKRCALRKGCNRNHGNRTLTREPDEAVMKEMAARVKVHPQIIKLRKQLCEHPFGTIKRFFGYNHFLLRELVKVRAEWSLMTLMYNLKRALNLVHFDQLMAVVGQCPTDRLARAHRVLWGPALWHLLQSQLRFCVSYSCGS